MPEARLTYLFDKYFSKNYSVAEKQELAVLILEQKNDLQVQSLLEHLWDSIMPDEDISPESAGSMFDQIIKHPSRQKFKSQENIEETIAHTRRISPWWRYVAAASLVIIFGLAAYFLAFNNKTTRQEVSKTLPITNDIPSPKSSNAYITLAHGKQIILDSSGFGKLASQGNVDLVKLSNGQIAYNKLSDNPEQEVEYNTLTNPKGSKVISITLVDGSIVWLNAESYLRFPTGFIGSERKVELAGEAYFEIAKNPKMPFKVKVNDKTEVEVTGTHFNVNAYKNEARINTTLLEGSVRVFSGNSSVLLTPGQQAQVNTAPGKQEIKKINQVNIKKVMAWKNGVFDFDDATLEEVMRELERWYDIDVAYEKGIPQLEFMGKLRRDLTLSQVLRGLEVSKVHFRIEGRKLTVFP